MLQNMLTTDTITPGKPGVFMLQKNDKRYCMFSGNYVQSDKTETLDKIVSAINVLTTDELTKYLATHAEGAESSKGKGLMQLRKISGHEIDHEILVHRSDPPFFILQIHLSK